jgi:N-acyl-D-aspartate/D-glutamate deacylase
MGNCGVGFAPCQKSLRPFLLDLMEAVEDIPGTALHEGIQWEWETFPEYLDALERRQYACDVAVMIGHGGVRTWVMGNRANVSDMPGGQEKDPVTPEEIARMAAVVREAVAAGALGFSTSRLLLHRDNRGILTPGALAAKDEMLRICDAVAEGGGGIFELSSDFSTYDDIPYHKMDEDRRKQHFKSELDWMADAMMKHKENLKVTFGVGAGMVPYFSNWAKKASQTPGQCMVQYQTRPQAYHMSHTSGKNLFTASRSYRQARKEAKGDTTKLLEMLRAPSLRAAILNDMGEYKPTGTKGVLGMFEMWKNDQGATVPAPFCSGWKTYPWTDSYEPADEMMLKNIAASKGQTPVEVAYDLLLDVEGPHAGIVWQPLFQYNGNNQNIADAFKYDNVLPGFDDAGAHGTILTDATSATSTITYLGRDRTRGSTVPLEKLVQTQTRDAAAIFGLYDRGVIEAGKRADINIMDLDKLNVKPPFWANDLPTEAGRWLQDVEGYCATILRGIVTFQDGQHSGELPGRLVRNPRSLGLRDDYIAIEASQADDPSIMGKDLKDYAVELSRGGGASAVARVLRDDKEPSAERSRL